MSSKTEITKDMIAGASTGPIVDILMYHSISDAGGPTSIPAPVFKSHMDIIEKASIPVITLDDYLAGRAGDVELPPYSIILTFDDGFLDFYEVAAPILLDKGFAAINYLPTGLMGGNENWRGANVPPRPLMNWVQVRELHEKGLQFGSHSVTHPDLDGLKTRQLVEELRQSRIQLEDQLGGEVRHFAPPYGIADYFARTTIEKLYQTSVGTMFERATLESDIIELPRLEMFYYASVSRWQKHVEGKGDTYMWGRRTMRSAREAISKPWERP